MTDILAVFRVEGAMIALTETVRHDGSAVVHPIRGAGTDPSGDRHLFSVRSADFDRFEAGLARDPTVDAFEQVVLLGDEAVYALRYTEEAVLFSTEVARQNGVVLEMENEGTAWEFKNWLPDRAAAQAIWEFGRANDVDVELVRINEYGSVLEGSYGLTAAQREAVLAALELGYFDEPRGVTLEGLAEELSISEPSASRLVRRGLKRLLTATLAESEE
ncbi:MAG: helix-turn-helix domain-containing protein [Halobacteriales archaeon]|nr:helix-turn-helix domain-containing protein [Halobacteriales archaeon]